MGLFGIVIGRLNDNFGPKILMSIAAVFFGLGFCGVSQVNTLWQLYLFACIYGFAHGSFFTVVSPIVAEFFGTASHGSIFGMVVFFGTTGGAIGPVVTGFLYDLTSSYRLPFLLFLVAGVTGLILLYFLTPVYKK
jgi:MFS family permease